ncbi:hypothetical protein BGI36_04185 [Snodgrassella communis]|uniref:hypothetical protein n=1 Tax=Snodgrassella communis TaxID=2946699 RepID=UPI000C1E7704|nr:hypothetical protein [Snodgrassella communis]PIT21940.1 hypothetical protein BGI35_05610 [Snodgrassella communis]PIT22099.1 hypothetical protein BGI36_04185 [Snodgrassella communis]
MNVLILTNHLADLCGSEIQVLELYNYFKNRNHNVKVYVNIMDYPIIEYFDKNDLLTEVEQINLDIIDIVWSQHCLFASLFQNRIYKELHIKLISVHLSPYEMLELCSVPYMKLLKCVFVANSLETKDKLISLGVDNDNILVSNNCAPSGYLNNLPKKKNLHNILVISNHVPQEIMEAIDILSEKYQVSMIGGKKPVLVNPELIKKYDMLIAIGKTVQYGLLSGIPIYCYDHFGGPGFLNHENFEVARYYNFSGRGFDKKTAKQITIEIEESFELASEFISEYSDKDYFLLENFMDIIINQKDILINQDEQQALLPYIAMEKKIGELYILIRKIGKQASYFSLALETTKEELKQKEKDIEKFSTELKLKTVTEKITLSEEKIISERNEKQRIHKKYSKFFKIVLIILGLFLVLYYC